MIDRKVYVFLFSINVNFTSFRVEAGAIMWNHVLYVEGQHWVHQITWKQFTLLAF